MESNLSDQMETIKDTVKPAKRMRKKFSHRTLRLSLRYRPKLLKFILKMKLCIKKKNAVIQKLNSELQQMRLKFNLTDMHAREYLKSSDSKDDSTQTKLLSLNDDNSKCETTIESALMWSSGGGEGSENKSIADQVKEAAQSAMQESGMVYVESAGMYYDYKTGYYYNSELGLYYHNDTGCYYYYSEDQKNFVFHSYPDRNALNANASLLAHEKRKARKHRKGKEEDATSTKAKRRKLAKKKKNTKTDADKEKIKEKDAAANDENISPNNEKPEKDLNGNTDLDEKHVEPVELEDGECSQTDDESSADEEVADDSDASTASTATNEESIAKHHPPCMRIIVRETNLPKLKVGSLFLVTKDGGTIGREGHQHTIVLKDHNVSRTHLQIRYNMEKRTYTVADLGSKNGTILNGIRMSESQVFSDPMEVLHGSVLQLGETKLLCHIHPGTDTCGHCEPGLLMETEEKEKKMAYTRTCSIQKQHQYELARLKNKYAPEPLMIEEKEYNDRARARREAVGSSHSAEKTQTTDLDTCIAPDNKGFKLLEKMGWAQGEGLGKDSQGETEPVPLVSNEGKAGLGTTGAVSTPPLVPTPRPRNKIGPATLRLASKTKMLQPPAKAFQNEENENDE